MIFNAGAHVVAAVDESRGNSGLFDDELAPAAGRLDA